MFDSFTRLCLGAIIAAGRRNKVTGILPYQMLVAYYPGQVFA